jgi:hypothetical protein
LLLVKILGGKMSPSKKSLFYFNLILILSFSLWGCGAIRSLNSKNTNSSENEAHPPLEKSFPAVAKDYAPLLNLKILPEGAKENYPDLSLFSSPDSSDVTFSTNLIDFDSVLTLPGAENGLINWRG